MAFVNLMDIVYPVGSVYMSTTNVSPANTIGGTWVSITDKFLKGADPDADNSLTTGGGNTHKLSQSELPKHTHNVVCSFNGSWHNVCLYPSNASSGGNDWIASWSDSYTNKSTAPRLATGDFDDPSKDDGGGDQPFDNQPAFITVYMWYRTA